MILSVWIYVFYHVYQCPFSQKVLTLIYPPDISPSKKGTDEGNMGNWIEEIVRYVYNKSSKQILVKFISNCWGNGYPHSNMQELHREWESTKIFPFINALPWDAIKIDDNKLILNHLLHLMPFVWVIYSPLSFSNI